MPIIIAILLGLSALLIVVYPLLGLDSAAAASAAGNDALADVAERERSAKMALRDVDFDYRLGNLEENDYEALRTRYERRALAALRTRYEREQVLDQLIDEQLAAMRDKKSGKNGNLAASPSPRRERGSGGEVPVSGKNGNRADAPLAQGERPGAKSRQTRSASSARPRRGKGA